MDLTHINEENKPCMVDIADKEITARIATAKSSVWIPNIIADKIGKDGEIQSKKGPVFSTAIIAGTMAVKNTSTLIPFCHPIAIEGIKIHINHESTNIISISCEVKTIGKTGVEMEALTGSSVAALTIYDMCKALSHEIRIESTHLVNKSGGKRNIVDGKKLDGKKLDGERC